MPDDEDDDIGGKVVGTVMMQLLAAHVASIVHFEKGSEHPAPAAARATAKKSPHKRGRRQLRGLEPAHYIPLDHCTKCMHAIIFAILTIKRSTGYAYGLDPYTRRPGGAGLPAHRRGADGRHRH